jgi:quercetin dioxygenase-like cupin family protein
MPKIASAFALVLVLQVAGLSQAPVPSLPLGQGRPETPGVTRTTLKDDAKSTVIRVHFKAGAAEPPHTHPYDIIIVPVVSGNVTVTIGDKKLTAVKSGDVQFVSKDVVHSVANTSGQEFELISVALK